MFEEVYGVTSLGPPVRIAGQSSWCLDRAPGDLSPPLMRALLGASASVLLLYALLAHRRAPTLPPFWDFPMRRHHHAPCAYRAPDDLPGTSCLSN